MVADVVAELALVKVVIGWNFILIKKLYRKSEIILKKTVKEVFRLNLKSKVTYEKLKKIYQLIREVLKWKN